MVLGKENEARSCQRLHPSGLTVIVETSMETLILVDELITVIKHGELRISAFSDELMMASG